MMVCVVLFWRVLLLSGTSGTDNDVQCSITTSLSVLKSRASNVVITYNISPLKMSGTEGVLFVTCLLKQFMDSSR